MNQNNISLKKVINGLKYHSEGNCFKSEDDETGCPYWKDSFCSQHLCSDALALLKAQKPRVMTLEEVIEAAKQGEPMYICEAKFPGSARWIIPINADHWGFEERGSHCQLHYYDYLSKQIGGFCCWTAEPTDEQKETVKWDD